MMDNESEELELEWSPEIWDHFLEQAAGGILAVWGGESSSPARTVGIATRKVREQRELMRAVEKLLLDELEGVTSKTELEKAILSVAGEYLISEETADMMVWSMNVNRVAMILDSTRNSIARRGYDSANGRDIS